jgi:hypothetical protein
MPRKVARANCFDASALVKLHVNEEGSDIMRGYFHNRAPGGYTTPFCFYEALDVLKSKWLIRGEITRDEYFGSAKNAKAARNESIRAWYVLGEPEP